MVGGMERVSSRTAEPAVNPGGPASHCCRYTEMKSRRALGRQLHPSGDRL